MRAALVLGTLAALWSGYARADDNLGFSGGGSLIPRGAGTMSYSSRTPAPVAIPGGLGALSVGNTTLSPITGITDALGNQPQIGDFCVVQLAPGSTLPSSVTLSRCDITATGQATITATAVVAVTALNSTSPSVNIFFAR